jgi:hypothetical protein
LKYQVLSKETSFIGVMKNKEIAVGEMETIECRCIPYKEKKENSNHHVMSAMGGS